MSKLCCPHYRVQTITVTTKLGKTGQSLNGSLETRTLVTFFPIFLNSVAVN